MGLKNYQGALNDFSKAIEIDNNYVNGFLSRGTANYKLENYRDSLLDFDKAIEISPNDSQIYIGRSIVKEKTNDIKGACSDIKKASNLSTINQTNKSWYKNNCPN
jgi:tetratricopeptide (TPR) repeat protein